jgi:hypothetical protein
VINSRGWPPAPATQIPVAARRVMIDFRASNSAASAGTNRLILFVPASRFEMQTGTNGS